MEGVIRPERSAVHEATPGSTALRDLGLSLAGTPLEALIQDFGKELAAKGVTRVLPRYYLSTEWGVPFGTISLAIPFYLARIDLTALHAERGGYVEGTDPADILRYLRHEAGHVVNYAYRLYERDDWRRTFGDIDLPYEEECRPQHFSRDYVLNLPGWYAQKHPDEDWAETFAVWMTPGADWRADYAAWPTALAKLQYCDRLMAELRDKDPPVTATESDEDVGDISLSLDEFYREAAPSAEAAPGLDTALRSIFENLNRAGGPSSAGREPAAELIHLWQSRIAAEVFRWTGHFPERTRRLLHHLARRAEQMGLDFPEDRSPTPPWRSRPSPPPWR
jgi:Putative zinc-binding metallo-peptidase